MTDSPLQQDRDARRAALVEFDRPLVIEAGAGTGKTTTLVGRILSWTLGRGWNEISEALEEAGKKLAGDELEPVATRVLEGLSAITFTEAAAAEMAARVAKGLATVAAGELDELPGFDPEAVETGQGPSLATRATTLLGHLDLLEVSTIHAFCHRRLTAHPLELGLHPAFRIDVELREIEETIRGVVDQRVRTAYADDVESPILEAAALGVGPQGLAETLLRLVEEAVPATALAADPFSPDRLGAIAADLRDQVESFLEIAGGTLEAVKRAPNAPRVARALAATRELLDSFDLDGDRAASHLCRTLENLWPRNLVDHLGKWGKRGFGQSESDALGERADPLRSLCVPLRNRLRHLTGLDPIRTDVFRRATGPLLEETESALRAAGLSHFAHILVETLRLFKEHPEVLAAERRAIRQLLVDEFQDTDLVQCEIVSLLAFAGEPDERPGLFVVGDPKQCIYGWRNADLEAYDGFCSRVRNEGGHTYQLMKNFRSAPAILDEVERSIEPVMHEERGLQPRFTGLEPSERTRDDPGFEVGAWAPVEGWHVMSSEMLTTGSLDLPRADALELEADAIARDISALHRDGGVAWNDCGVLFRAMSHLEEFLEAFRRHGVPFAVTSDKQYFRRREVIEAAALVRTVVNPVDQLALVTWLRSPAVGVPDAALIPLWRHGFPGLAADLGREGFDGADIEEAVRNAAAETATDIPGIETLGGWDANLLASLDSLCTLRQAFRRDPADRFVELLRQKTLVEASEAARFLGHYRVANLDRFFRRLRLAIVESRGNIQAVLRALRRSVSEAHEAEEALPKDAAEDAVQVMTIHKAKGLEFEHVYLVQIDAGTWGREAKPTDADRRWGPLGPEEYVLFDSPTLGFDEVTARREKIAAAEQVRLLYVALTRARRRVVLSGQWTARGAGSTPTFLALLDQRSGLPDDWIRLATTAVKAGGWTDSGDIRWRFPGLVPSEEDHDRGVDGESLPTKAELRRATQRLAEQCAEADERKERRLIGAASERESEQPDSPRFGVEARGREAALAIGSAIHAALERWNFDGDPDTEAEAQRSFVRASLAARLTGEELRKASDRAEELVERLRDGKVLPRLARLSDRLVARELPVLLPSSGEAPGPLVGVSGVADLLFRREDDDRLVVVDYKTDEIVDDDALEERARAYSSQLEIYTRALEQALALGYTPDHELWFIWPDRVWKSS